jgi:hypothetical protein
VPAPKSVIDLLRDQPDDVLDAMYESIRATVERLTVELRQIEEARSRRPRRTGTARPTGNGRRSGVGRRDMYEEIKKLGPGRSYAPAEVRQMFTERGFSVSANAVRNSLARLVDVDGLLERDENGLYRLPEPKGDLFSQSGGSV